MHLKEGASGVPSRVGMAKTGRCGGEGGRGDVDARVEAMLGRKLQAGRLDKPRWRKGAVPHPRVGIEVPLPAAAWGAGSPLSLSLQHQFPLLLRNLTHALARPALSLAKLDCHSQRSKDAKQRKGWDLEEFPLPRHLGLG